VSRKKALIKGIIRAKFRINQTFSNDKSEINSRAGKIRENTKRIINTQGRQQRMLFEHLSSAVRNKIKLSLKLY
jgi:hypothetical protein